MLYSVIQNLIYTAVLADISDFGMVYGSEKPTAEDKGFQKGDKVYAELFSLLEKGLNTNGLGIILTGEKLEMALHSTIGVNTSAFACFKPFCKITEIDTNAAKRHMAGIIAQMSESD
jgi:hypothetical protein